MRARWTIVGGTSFAAVVIAAVIVGHSYTVSGDTTSGTSTLPPMPPLNRQDPFAPYPLGPGAIAYDQLSAVDKAGVDHIQEVVETSQTPASYQAFASATAWTSADADRQIAARAVGLQDTAQDGVVP